MNIVIVDYGMGNLASVSRALGALGHRPTVVNSPKALRTADRIVLPGVGSFAEGMDRLDGEGWSEELKRQVVERAVPLLGICLGMQFLAEAGVEGGERRGLGLVPGRVTGLRELGCQGRVPHVGWNEVRQVRSDPLWGLIPDDTDFYFVHSYALVVTDTTCLVGTVRYGCDVAAVVRNDNVWGTQFHPEKSSKAGMRLLANFVGSA